MRIELRNPKARLTGAVDLPSSKSISNRLLIIRALCDKSFEIQNLSQADDTRILQEALQSRALHVNIDHAGTAMRFLTAYYAATGRHAILDGSARMRLRPISPLVNALKQLGASIRYLEQEGHPPIEILPGKLKSGSVLLDGTISSQFISALMLIAPILDDGLELKIQGRLVSEPYMFMTARLMQTFGSHVVIADGRMSIGNTGYISSDTSVESDWSSAAFWYAWLAVADPGSELLLNNLKVSGLQGDEYAMQVFNRFGVTSTEVSNSIRITKADVPLPTEATFDLIRNPDLAPAVAATMVALRVKGTITGLQTLNLKESDRISVLRSELEKVGAVLHATSDSLAFTGFGSSQMVALRSHNDHRIAMALSCLTLKTGRLVIDDAESVSKSYPGFWDEIRKLGVELTLF